MKRTVILAAVLALCLCLLTACSCKHEWAEATCEAPKTCTLCGETEGEALGHSWTDATCAAPKTCANCAETEGAALPHTWEEANYQDPKTCSVCSATEGTPLEADFEKYGIEIDMYENKHYEYNTEGSASYYCRDPFFLLVRSKEKPEDRFTGEVYICNYRIINSDENHPPVEGYEWRAFDLEIAFYADLSVTSPVSFNYMLDNYYDISAWDNDSTFELAGTEWDRYAGTGVGVVTNYHGKDYPCVLSIEGDGFISNWYKTTIYDENDNPIEMYRTNFSKSIYACVPIGFDGVVYGLKCGTNDSPTSEIANDDALFFRMDNTMVEW